MSLIEQPRRPLSQDYRDAPDWFQQFLYVYNYNNDRSYNALNGSLHIGDNISGFIRVIEFTTRSDYATGGWDQIAFLNSTSTKLNGLLIGQINIVSGEYIAIEKATTVNWREVNGQIQVNYIAGLDPSIQYELTLIGI